MVTFLKNWPGPPMFFSPPCSKVEAQQANFGPPMVPLPFKCHMVGQVHWGLVVSWAGIVHHWLCRIVVLYSSCIIFWGQVNQTSREINPMFSRSANHQFPWSYGSNPAAWASLEIRVPLRVPAPMHGSISLARISGPMAVRHDGERWPGADGSASFRGSERKEGSMRFTRKPDYPADERGPVQMKIMKHCDQRV